MTCSFGDSSCGVAPARVIKWARDLPAPVLSSCRQHAHAQFDDITTLASAHLARVGVSLRVPRRLPEHR